MSCVCVLNDLGCLWFRKHWGLRYSFECPKGQSFCHFLASLPHLWCSLPLSLVLGDCTWPEGPTGSLWDYPQGLLSLGREALGLPSMPPHSSLPWYDRSSQSLIPVHSFLPTWPPLSTILLLCLGASS